MYTRRHPNPHIAEGLAKAALVGLWSADDMASRFASVLHMRSRRKWLKHLVARILGRFGFVPPLPSLFRLSRFILHDAAFEKIVRQLSAVQERLWESDSALKAALNLNDLPRPHMTPAGKFHAAAEIPALVTPGELARWLNVSSAELDWFADCFGRERERPEGALRHYRYRWIPKSSGGKRLVEIPKRRLKEIQRHILHEILSNADPHEAAHAFREGCSTATGAAQHIGQRAVLRIDLREFYPSVHSGRVQGVYRTLGYPEPVARLLTGLCTNTVPTEILADEFPTADVSAVPDGLSVAHLPQGAPTSPALANLCGFRLDCRLAGLARRQGVQYTRYADDLVFSGDREFERNLARFRVFVCAIVLNEGFTIRRRKTRVMRSGSRQEVTGIVVNQRLNVPRQEFDRLKAILHNCVMLGPHEQNREGHGNFREHLRGRIAYVQMIHPVKGERLRMLFDRIDWVSDHQ
jgi:RNA-directed DNA polymerase